eukprot:715419-Rhodomonas_salina.1
MSGPDMALSMRGTMWGIQPVHPVRRRSICWGSTGRYLSTAYRKPTFVGRHTCQRVSLMLAPHAESVLAITQCIRSTGRIRDVDVGLGGVKVGDVEREHDFVAPLRPFAVWRFHHDAGPPHCVSH